MGRLTKSELVNGFPVCYPKNHTGLPEYVMEQNPYRDIVEKLKHYEDLQEQGRLLELPCAVGDDVWFWDKELDSIEEAPFAGYVWGYAIESAKTAYIIIVPKSTTPSWLPYERKLEIEDFGKTIFITRKEAEAAVKKDGGAING